MNDVTQILSRIESGDLTASERLLPLVYDDCARALEAPFILLPTVFKIAQQQRKNSKVLVGFVTASK